MLEQLSDRVRECHHRAAEAKALADAAGDPARKAAFLSVESHWVALARSIAFTERLSDFSAASSERLRSFEKHPKSAAGSARGVHPLGAERILQSIVENSDDAIITKNLDGIITSWNKSAERIFGYSAEEAIGRPVTILIPPGRDDEEPSILARLRRGERIDHYETVRQRKDGGLINISLTVSPITNALGQVVGASKIARDITDRKQHEAHTTILAREAEHRTKNILATVQAIINLSRSDTVDGFKRAINGRIKSLATLHGLFANSRWTGAELSNIASQELGPYRGEDEARVRIDGPHVFLAPDTAQAIGVILHELATNAAKYGSLSVPKGQVNVTWMRAADAQLILRWTESGGPTVEKPSHRGFGTTAIEQMMRQFKGELHIDWRTEGLVCEIVVKI